MYPNSGYPQYPPPGGYPPQGYAQQPPTGYPQGAYYPPTTGYPACTPGVNPYAPQGSVPSGYYPGLMAYEQIPSLKMGPCDPTADAAALRKAMKGLGTDEATIISILSKRTDAQRQQIKAAFSSTFGRDLIKDLKSELSGNFEDAVIALMTPRAEFLASKLKDAMSGIGTREKILIDILCMAENQEIREINFAYLRLYKKSMDSDINGDTSGCFKKLLISLTKANRSEDPRPDQAAAEADAQALYKAGEKKIGTDEEKFNMIFATRSFVQLRLIDDAYQKISSKGLEGAIKSEFSGDIEKALLAILRCAKNRAGYFAKRIHESVDGLGTKDDDLIFLIVSRAEIDMENIKKEYEKLYKKSLQADVSGDCSGDYKRFLLALIG